MRCGNWAWSSEKIREDSVCVWKKGKSEINNKEKKINQEFTPNCERCF
jgi:hypothetical protein